MTVQPGDAAYAAEYARLRHNIADSARAGSVETAVAEEACEDRNRLADVQWIMQTHRPGSGDWTWEQEFADLRDRDGAALEALRRGVAVVGIREPLLLGDDGRVWDGHHRLLVAVDLGIERVPIRWGRSGPVAGSPVHERETQRAICSGGGPSRTPGKVLIEFLVDEGTVRRLGSEWLLTPLGGVSS